MMRTDERWDRFREAEERRRAEEEIATMEDLFFGRIRHLERLLEEFLEMFDARKTDAAAVFIYEADRLASRVEKAIDAVERAS